MRPRILVLHGPNLNLLGQREPGLYGEGSLSELDDSLLELGESLDVEVVTRQSNHEGELIEAIHAEGVHAAGGRPVGIVFNPGGYTHTSVALEDALRAVRLPAVEVHLTNLFRRESARQRSVTAPACVGVVMGLGPASYALAVRYLAGTLRTAGGSHPTAAPQGARR